MSRIVREEPSEAQKIINAMWPRVGREFVEQTGGGLDEKDGETWYRWDSTGRSIPEQVFRQAYISGMGFTLRPEQATREYVISNLRARAHMFWRGDKWGRGQGGDSACMDAKLSGWIERQKNNLEDGDK